MFRFFPAFVRLKTVIASLLESLITSELGFTKNRAYRLWRLQIAR